MFVVSFSFSLSSCRLQFCSIHNDVHNSVWMFPFRRLVNFVPVPMLLCKKKKMSITWDPWLEFYGIWTFTGYLMPNPVYIYIYIYIHNVILYLNNNPHPLSSDADWILLVYTHTHTHTHIYIYISVHFRTNTLGKGMNPLILPSMD